MFTSGDFFSTIENRAWDLRAKLIAPYRVSNPHIRLITIDQRSLDYYANQEGITWPWPRALYVPVIEFLKQSGAAAVGFDLLFTESSVQGVDDDVQLAASMNGSLPVVNAAVVESDKITMPVKEILTASPLIGAVNGTPDSDGIFRRIKPRYELPNQIINSLPLALLNAIKKTDPEIPAEKNLILNFRQSRTTYAEDNIVNIISSYVATTEGKPPLVDPAIFKDAIVLVGVTAPGLLDLRPTSVDSVFRGVEFNATALDNFLSNDFIKKVSTGTATSINGIWIIFLTASLLFSRRIRSQLLLSAVALGSFIAVSILCAWFGFWIPFAIPFAALLLAMIFSLGVQYQLEGKQVRFIQSAFSHYVSPTVIDRIIANPTHLKLGGERKELTIFFSDIRGFTSISEKMAADQLVSLLNLYLTEMTDIILESGGTVDKYEGDAIIAFWNAPLPVADHATKAVTAALKCQTRLHELQELFENTFGVQPYTRIGLHTGNVTVGNFGSRDRFDYTVIGDAANFASRLEGVNKVFGTNILISEITADRCKDSVLSRRIGAIQVVGKTESVMIYEPLNPSQSYATPEQRQLFMQALDAFESQQLDMALRLFRNLTNDPVAAAYAVRISNIIEKSTSAAWSSVWLLDAK